MTLVEQLEEERAKCHAEISVVQVTGDGDQKILEGQAQGLAKAVEMLIGFSLDNHDVMNAERVLTVDNLIGDGY